MRNSDTETIIGLYKAGNSILAIAEAAGLSEKATSEVIRAAGFDTLQEGRTRGLRRANAAATAKREALDRDVRALHAKEMLTRDIAETMCVSIGVVRGSLKRQGLRGNQPKSKPRLKKALRKPTKARGMTQEELDAILKLYEAGSTLQQLSAAFDRSESSLRSHIRAARGTLQRRRKERLPDELRTDAIQARSTQGRAIVRLHLEGASAEKISEYLKIPLERVERCIEKANERVEEKAEEATAAEKTPLFGVETETFSLDRASERLKQAGSPTTGIPMTGVSGPLTEAFVGDGTRNGHRTATVTRIRIGGEDYLMTLIKVG